MSAELLVPQPVFALHAVKHVSKHVSRVYNTSEAGLKRPFPHDPPPPPQPPILLPLSWQHRGCILMPAVGGVQARWGQKPDGVCMVVGSCCRGFHENNTTGELEAAHKWLACSNSVSWRQADLPPCMCQLALPCRQADLPSRCQLALVQTCRNPVGASNMTRV